MIEASPQPQNVTGRSTLMTPVEVTMPRGISTQPPEEGREATAAWMLAKASTSAKGRLWKETSPLNWLMPVKVLLPVSTEPGTVVMGVKEGMVPAAAWRKVWGVALEELSSAHSWVPPWEEGQRISAT